MTRAVQQIVWLAAQDLLAASLGAKHIKSTHSGHNVYLYEPQMVVDAIRKTVDEVRSKPRSTRRSRRKTRHAVATVGPDDRA